MQSCPNREGESGRIGQVQILLKTCINCYKFDMKKSSGANARKKNGGLVNSQASKREVTNNLMSSPFTMFPPKSASPIY